jgi:hypothetical protein
MSSQMAPGDTLGGAPVMAIPRRQFESRADELGVTFWLVRHVI